MKEIRIKVSWNEFYNTITDAELILQKGGFWTLLLIVLLENGVIFGIFLPGDYLLLLAGVYCDDYLGVNIYLLTISVWLAALAGTYIGYVTGNYSGRKFLQKDTWLVKQKHIIMTRAYFIKFGGRTIVFSKFLPYVRTLAPILAGVVEMKLSNLIRYAVFGSGLWVLLFVAGGYILGSSVPEIKDYMHYFVVGLVIISSSVVIYSYLKTRLGRQTRTKAPDNG